MQTESFIPGKDASLESTIATMQKKLAARGFELVESSLLHEVDGIWSTHMKDKECPMLFSNGKGATELAARASAYGEFFERLGTHYFWTHFHLGATRANAAFVHYPQERWFAPTEDGSWPAELLNPELQEFYNPDGAIDGEVLVDLNSGNVARGICALPYTRLRDEALTYIPVNIIGNLYVSNGMAAGNTMMEARSQALSEIFERQIKYRIISEGLCLPEVPDEVIARFPSIHAGISGLRKAGFGILVKDASLGGLYPVMNVTLVHPKDQGVFSSYGAHPRFEIALERAMTELLQGRALDSLEGFPEPGFDMSEINAVANLEIHFVDSSGVISWNFMGDTPDFPFADWNFSTTTEEDYRWLVDCIHREGKDIYVSDFSEQGAYSCRILVPGMSEIYPVEDLEWENNSIGNLIRPALVRLSDLSEPEAAELLSDLQTMNLNDERPLWEILGLAIPVGTPWKQLRIGELKTLLALAIGDEDAIREGCDWIHHFKDLAPARRLVYRCIESILQIDNVDNYRRSLDMLYGADTVRQAEALINRQERFFGLDTLGEDMQGSAMHQTLLAAYDKLFAADR
ncbi:30S ribosomal protein S12 methylthiotransferase accessory factor YcaO [Herbaspirillum sp. RTI4]|uniref:30S ribosomal protein S12 methylthiotransferase accessory factor YcaO n=1 Tax=Herbaspirillum sp. RTI4 TaxID=3048640 RepID=UPI002AB44FDA|nr:30S ribosomal protein S12 methylthiotransferase accessory factor YcaO [Herbaspirillum sp. RTI4]MDY7579236.1 30S ribosomal protein S12 methylthiotransferase accessory factor YcaO [Herbaspirillum sp. RTI4]MEA9982631.1 30S ribosomal protein S12 methylthiotransferase accessory factor YcaO [Herbaspirillum sp. RTI4]